MKSETLALLSAPDNCLMCGKLVRKYEFYAENSPHKKCAEGWAKHLGRSVEDLRKEELENNPNYKIDQYLKQHNLTVTRTTDSKCGFLFNRHSWNYCGTPNSFWGEPDSVRICMKCGVRQTYVYGYLSESSHWKKV
jgi:hypothetical protein